jgi:tRNA(adenine34) deaminase
MTDSNYLLQAITFASQSPEPVGCGVVIVQHGTIVAAAHNSQRADNIAVHHAEIKAIIEANKRVGSRKLEGATAYCSCEPCAMCLTALSYAKVARIVFHKRMKDLFPDDPQSQLDAPHYIKGLNFQPQLEQLDV